MEIFGIGWQELIFILIIALIVLGPKDMQKAGRTLGRWLNQLVQSDSWKVFQRTSSELRNLPRNLMREANMEMREAEKEIRRSIDPRIYPPASTGSSSAERRAGRIPSKDSNPAPQPPAGAPSVDAASKDEAESTRDPEEHV
ncbi:MAG TPA: twin-arginine translocase TatA/TatE family subunit [Anaerolineales bacterium]|nr:twin-arginine translocase TatA/TatE family subunit [Anaerolineales bacterium]